MDLNKHQKLNDLKNSLNLNLKRNGSMKFFGIDKEKLNDYETVLSTFTVQQSKIGLNYSKVFG